MGYKIHSLYKWDNLRENSPRGQTRNQWLYDFGAFCSYRGIWFPCNILTLNIYGEPAVVAPIRNSTKANDYSLYPTGNIPVHELDCLYTVFNNGHSIRNYIFKETSRIALTTSILDSALQRSLNTEIIAAPDNMAKNVKKALNTPHKGERYVVSSNMIGSIEAIELPHTADLIEKLWNSNDWARQELSELLGISYNPSQGKKERLLVDEVNGDRDLTVMHRIRLTERLIEDAEKYGEEVCHISDYIEERKERKYNDRDIVLPTDNE